MNTFLRNAISKLYNAVSAPVTTTQDGLAERLRSVHDTASLLYKFHVVSMYLFRRNFDGRKVHFVSTYFFCCNFDGRKIHVVSTYFFRCNFDGRKIHVISTYFFLCNFDGRKIHLATTYFFDVISLVEISTMFLLVFLKYFY